MNVAIVGGGTRCLYLLDFIKKDKFNLFRPNVIAVADVKEDAPGLLKAKEMGIPVTNDYNDFFARDDIALIVELVGDLDIYNDILAKKKTYVRAMAHTTALLFWEVDNAYKKANDSEIKLNEIQTIYGVLMNQFMQEEAMIIDKHYRILDINEAMLKKLGLTSEEAIGQYCYKIGHHLDQPCSGENHPCPLNEIYKKNKACAATHTHYDQNNNAIYYAISCYPLTTNDEIIGVIEIMRDITQEIKVEKAHMQQEKLISIGRLSAGIAHEINNPLTTIMTSSMMLQEDLEKDAEMYNELAVITNEAQRCRKIVQSLLDFARQTKPMKKLDDINTIVRESIYLTKKQAEFKDIYVSSNLAEDLPQIHVDKEQLQQIMINLMLNAVEATPPGGSIAFTTAYAPSNEEITIKISDTGMGISPENQEKIFDPFFTTREDGTGLGLSITHSLVEQNGGRIEIDSQPGKGTRFDVILPVGGSRSHDE